MHNWVINGLLIAAGIIAIDLARPYIKKWLIWTLVGLSLLSGCSFAPPHMPDPDRVPYTLIISGLPDVQKVQFATLQKYYVLPDDSEVLVKIGNLPYHQYQPVIGNCKDFAREAYGACAFTGWPVFMVLEKDHAYIG